MLYEDNWLAHYGIKGQKWGVRRYQNPDGSYTKEGLKRREEHLIPKFEKASADVRKGLSNTPKQFVQKQVDIVAVRQRGKLTDSEVHKCVFYANALFEEAAAAEPQITKDVIRSVSSSGGNMYGLENRLKQPTSLAAKIGSDAKEDDISFEASASGIKDAIRYTVVADDKSFVDNYIRVKSALEQKGYSEIRCKNYFALYKNGEARHKAVQCVWQDKNGQPFEIQFQTLMSQAAKELKTPIYEKRRSSGLSDAQKRSLERQMIELAEFVPYPENILAIESHG